MRSYYAQARRYRHAILAVFIIAFAGREEGGSRTRTLGQLPREAGEGGGGMLGLGPFFGGLGRMAGSGWGFGVDAALVNVTVGPLDPSVQLVPVQDWALDRVPEIEFQYAFATTEEATATFRFNATFGTTLYYQTPTFDTDTSVTLSLDGISSRLNITQSRNAPSTTIVFAEGLRAGTHIVAVGPAIVDGRVLGTATFGQFLYTIDDELIPASPSSSLPAIRPTSTISEPIDDLVNAPPPKPNNLKLVIPLAIVGALLGVLLIGIILLWIFKFPHYCCGPARRVIYKVATAPEPKRDDMGVVDLTDGEGRASSTTEEGYGGKQLPPTPTEKVETTRGAPPTRKLPQWRFKVPAIPGLAALSTKVKSARFNSPAKGSSRGIDPSSSTSEIDRHFELMTTGSPPLDGAPYLPPNNDSNKSFDPRTLVAQAATSNSDLSYVTAPPTSYPPLHATPAPPASSPLRQLSHGNPYLLNSNPKAPKQNSTLGVGVDPIQRVASPATPTVTARQLALDLPYLQYLDALTAPAGRISQLLSRSPSNAASSHRTGSSAAGATSVTPLSNKHLAALNVEVQKEKERENNMRRRGTEESADARPPPPSKGSEQETVKQEDGTAQQAKTTKTGSKFKLGNIASVALGKSKSKPQEQPPPTTPPSEVQPPVPSSSNADGGGGVDDGPVGTGMTGVTLSTDVTGMTIAATGAPTLFAGSSSGMNQSHRASSTVIDSDASPHPKKTSFWGVLTGNNNGQNTITLPSLPDLPQTPQPSFGDSMVVTQPRSRTTSASNQGPPPSSMWKMAVPQRKRRDSSVERERREKMGPREGRMQKEAAVAPLALAHTPNQESMSSSGHGDGKIRPLPPVAPLKVAARATRELPKPSSPPAEPTPPPQASPEPESQPSRDASLNASRSARAQPRSPEVLQQQLNDVLGPPSSPPAQPSSRSRSEALRVQAQSVPPRMDTGSPTGHVAGGARRPLPPPPPPAAAAAAASGSVAPVHASSPPVSAPQPIVESAQPAPDRANPPPPRPPPRPSLPPSTVSPPVLGSQSRRVPVPPVAASTPQPPQSQSQSQPQLSSDPPVASYQLLPPVAPSTSLASDWTDMTFGMGRSKPKPVSQPLPSPPPPPTPPPVPIPAPIPAPSAPPPVSYPPSSVAPTVYSSGTYDDEDGEDSIYADYEGTWPPAPSTSSVPPTPSVLGALGVINSTVTGTPTLMAAAAVPKTKTTTAAEGNPNYPDHPKPPSMGTTKARIRPKGPSVSLRVAPQGTKMKKKDGYDPVWRPDVVGGSGTSRR